MELEDLLLRVDVLVAVVVVFVAVVVCGDDM